MLNYPAAVLLFNDVIDLEALPDTDDQSLIDEIDADVNNPVGWDSTLQNNWTWPEPSSDNTPDEYLSFFDSSSLDHSMNLNFSSDTSLSYGLDFQTSSTNTFSPFPDINIDPALLAISPSPYPQAPSYPEVSPPPQNETASTLDVAPDSTPEPAKKPRVILRLPKRPQESGTKDPAVEATSGGWLYFVQQSVEQSYEIYNDVCPICVWLGMEAPYMSRRYELFRHTKSVHRQALAFEDHLSAKETALLLAALAIDISNGKYKPKDAAARKDSQNLLVTCSGAPFRHFAEDEFLFLRQELDQWCCMPELFNMCENCGKPFSRPDSLKRHLKNKICLKPKNEKTNDKKLVDPAISITWKDTRAHQATTQPRKSDRLKARATQQTNRQGFEDREEDDFEVHRERADELEDPNDSDYRLGSSSGSQKRSRASDSASSRATKRRKSST